MDERRLGTWLRRGTVVLAGVLVVGWLVGVWLVSTLVEREVLTPQERDLEYDLEVVTVSGGSIVLTRTPLTERAGVWGVASESAYGQVSTIIGLRDDVVERAFRTIEGVMGPGDRVRFDDYAFTGDPRLAHGIAFEEMRFAGELGAYPAWRIEGDRDTWIIVVHGLGTDERRQALRILPVLQSHGFPVLVITYRNDRGAPAASNGRSTWGRLEWRDVEAAMRFAALQGAEEFILYGFSVGGGIASMVLHESDLVGRVVGVVLDSPVLDLEAAVDMDYDERGTWGIFVGAAKTLATLRFDVDWHALDQVERADEFDVDMLLMHGSGDTTAPVATSDDFAAARPDIVRYERFDGADHGFLWNEDPVRYEAAVLEFLDRVAAPQR